MGTARYFRVLFVSGRTWMIRRTRSVSGHRRFRSSPDRMAVLGGDRDRKSSSAMLSSEQVSQLVEPRAHFGPRRIRAETQLTALCFVFQAERAREIAGRE